MKRAQKLEGKKTQAFTLGNNEATRKMIAEGKIKDLGNGLYELLSQESVNGKGEIAKAGDYFKVDGAGYPYPNAKEWFEINHRHIDGDDYEQIPKPLDAWSFGEEKNEVVQYLFDNNLMIVNPDDDQKYFSAELWGTTLSTPKDSVIIIYGYITDNGKITNVDFNFVARDEFEKTYKFVD